MLDERPRRHPDLHLWFTDHGELLAGRPGRGAVRASRQVIDLLAACDGARRIDEVAAALLERGALGAVSAAAAEHVVRALVAQARAAGLLAGPVGDDDPGGYGHPAVHRRMLKDAPRTGAFERALAAVVRPGDVVIDVGAGTGVLSAFAARAGAAAVHAVERACPATLRQALRDNGLDGRVVVHAGDARALELPRARVIVSEWMGVLLFGDDMWPAVARVRDRCLEPGGVMVPSRVELLLAPVEDPALRDEGPGWWDEPRWGLDLSAFGAREARAPQRRLVRVPEGGLLAAPAGVLRVDCARDGAEAGRGRFEASFHVERDGTLDAFAAWFVADLAPGVVLDTGPAAPPTHWAQDALAVRPHALRRGQRLEVALELSQSGPGDLTCALDARLDGAPLLAARYV